LNLEAVEPQSEAGLKYEQHHIGWLPYLFWVASLVLKLHLTPGTCKTSSKKLPGMNTNEEITQQLTLDTLFRNN
jgi:hypothetical protein